MCFFLFNRFIAMSSESIIQKYVCKMHLSAANGTAMNIMSTLSKQITNINIVLLLYLKKN